MLKSNVLYISVFEPFVLPIVDDFLISLLQLFYTFFMAEKHFFLLSSPLFLFSCFLSFFYLSSCFVKGI